MKINTLKKIINKISIFLFILLLNFNISFAQDNAKQATQNFKETADNLTNNVLTSAGTLLMTAAFVFFFYGVVIFIYGRATGKDGNDLKKGKEFMLWGLIALFVMVSVWGIIKLAQGLLDVDSNEIKIQPVQFASLNTGSGGSSSVGSDTNPLKTGGDTGGGDFAGTKNLGEVCKVLPGTTSECKAGMLCRGSGGSSISVGSTGTCQNIYSSGDTNRPQGAECVGQPGSQTQCASGLWCRDSKGAYVAAGQSGNCKSTLSQSVSRFPLIGPGYTGDYLGSVYAYLDYKKCIPSNMKYLPNDKDAFFSNVYNDYYKLVIESFQKANNISVDGKVGSETWPVLVSSSAKNCK